jgi:hypothetical protein
VGEWRYSSTIFDLRNIWRSVVSFTYRPLYPRDKSSLYPLERKLGELQNQSRHCGEDKISCPCQEPNPSCPAHSLSLHQLNYSGSVKEVGHIGSAIRVHASWLEEYFIFSPTCLFHFSIKEAGTA